MASDVYAAANFDAVLLVETRPVGPEKRSARRVLGVLREAVFEGAFDATKRWAHLSPPTSRCRVVARPSHFRVAPRIQHQVTLPVMLPPGNELIHEAALTCLIVSRRRR